MLIWLHCSQGFLFVHCNHSSITWSKQILQEQTCVFSRKKSSYLVSQTNFSSGWMPTLLSANIIAHRYAEHAGGVMVISAENEIGRPSPNSCPGCCVHFAVMPSGNVFSSLSSYP